ncbi:LysR family transcriptional regulator [Aliivibrio sp. 1S165]|uniref:LysR family transcriptional regulator n=1 Tax=unclassified Aliivibrio TaxID=2645654 RepID=UPI00080EDF31|nr:MULTISPECIES: LysR family transcriptional regulator [unclassified Aliivibrio]OCH16656.1 LysR family transcriptional regulator [Aliivibrio sp. 1S165]OCH32891.1 LysR family transcriptional regulator [Aliivibrio sp. 1S175]
MDQLRALKYFTATVEAGNFSAAAKKFDVPASSISRRIADLEASLGAQLLKRTTRTVSLTEVGQQYYTQVTALVQQLEQCDQAVKNYQTTPTGTLKISAMVGFGERILAPILDEFILLYPDILLDVVLSDELSKLDRDDVDIAIRGGYAPDERVVAIYLMDNRFIPAASPSYLKKYGHPTSTKELPNHKGLYFKTPNGPTPWLSEINGEWQEVSAPSILTTNNGKWLTDKAIKGAGIIMMPRWVLEPHLQQGELVELTFNEPLNITQNQTLAVYMLYQKLAYATPKVKAAVDFIVARIKGNK